MLGSVKIKQLLFTVCCLEHIVVFIIFYLPTNGYPFQPFGLNCQVLTSLPRNILVALKGPFCKFDLQRFCMWLNLNFNLKNVMFLNLSLK